MFVNSFVREAEMDLPVWVDLGRKPENQLLTYQGVDLDPGSLVLFTPGNLGIGNVTDQEDQVIDGQTITSKK